MSTLGQIMMMTRLLGGMGTEDILNPSPTPYNPSPMKPQIPKGKLFIIEGKKIYALNEKNAIRKFKALKYDNNN